MIFRIVALILPLPCMAFAFYGAANSTGFPCFIWGVVACFFAYLFVSVLEYIQDPFYKDDF